MARQLDLGALLERSESDTLDYKARAYDISDEQSKINFVKDVVSMANTPREETAYILLGVWDRGAYREVQGATSLEDASLHEIAASYLNPAPYFRYSIVSYDDKNVGLIEIPVDPKQQEPSCVKIDYKNNGRYKNTLSPGAIYYRYGSGNRIADEKHVRDIRRWFFDHSTLLSSTESNPYAYPPAWDKYIESVDGLHANARHILILGAGLTDTSAVLEGLGTAPWSAVFDFDPMSDTDGGVLASVRPTLEKRRSIHLLVKGDESHSVFSATTTTKWFFPLGFVGRADSMPPSDFQRWRWDYGDYLKSQYEKLGTELVPHAVHVTVLWENDDQIDYLEQMLDGISMVFRQSLHVTIVVARPTSYQSIERRFNAVVVDIPIHVFAQGLQQHMTDDGDMTHEVTVPSKSGIQVPIPADKASWIAEEIDLVPRFPDRLEHDESTMHGTAAFLRGGLATWTDIDVEIDARRDVHTRLHSALLQDLTSTYRTSTRFHLYHRPGAGGTTVARRIAWTLHGEFPSGILKHTSGRGTMERLSYLHEVTDRPTFLVVDSQYVTENDVDTLMDALRAERVPAVVLVVSRDSRRRRAGERTFDLDSQLSRSEANRFFFILSRDMPNREVALEELAEQKNQGIHMPIYFALTAYGSDFLALADFVSSRTRAIDEAQRRALKYLAIASRFGQRSISAYAFRTQFGLDMSGTIKLKNLFRPDTAELLVEDEPGQWRVGHWLVADELLRQLLTAEKADERTWVDNLANEGVAFINFCRGDLPVAGDEMTQLVRRVFVYRGYQDELRTVRATQGRFAEFIETVPNAEASLRLLQSLVMAFPDEPHFHAHLGRFHSKIRRDFASALQEADEAVALAGEKDHVVYHMRGVVYRDRVDQLRRERASLEELVGIAEKASEDFAAARRMNFENEYGYISEAEMLIDLLAHIKRTTRDLFGTLRRADTPPYIRDALDETEFLLAQVRRHASWEGETSSPLEIKASGAVRELYDDFAGAREKLDSILDLQGVYQPPIRRQLAWTHLAEAEGLWAKVPQSGVRRIMDLLARNLDENPQSGRDVEMWLNAGRSLERPPSITLALEKVQYWWGSASSSTTAAYYGYVLSAIAAMEGSAAAEGRYREFLYECRRLTRSYRHQTRSHEWLREGRGLAKLISAAELGEWDSIRGFWRDTLPLARVEGVVGDVRTRRSGWMMLNGGIEAMFVPAVADISSSDRNSRISAYLGFSYDGPRAWGVERI